MPGGRLIFKGGETAVSSKSKKHKKKKKDKKKDAADEAGTAGDVLGTRQREADETPDQAFEELRPIVGSGRITSSGTVVHGHNAKFMEELKNGDAIIIQHPTTLMEETRIVKMVLSNMSLSISSPFSSDLITTTGFRYIAAPRAVETDESRAEAAKKRRVEEEKSAFGTYAGGGGTKMVYRVRKSGTYGGYQIMEENVNGNMSREELLDMRSKKKADRHCA